MQYLIRVKCDEVEGFRRDILIDEDANFLDLSKAILESVGFPDDQMTSFFICNDNWERREQITREDCREAAAADMDVLTMADTPLADFLDAEGITRMEYIFDPFCERTFNLRVVSEEPGFGDAEVVNSRGKAPKQIADMDTAAAAIIGAGSLDLASDFADDLFSDDELDLDGFEITENF